MTKLHRKDLKHDEFREKLTDAFRDVTIHRKEALYILLIVIAIGIVAAAWYYFEKNQRNASQALLGVAIDKYNSSTGEDIAQLDPSVPKPKYSFKTDAEKYQAVLKDFEQIEKKYSNTPASEIARYYAGACAFYLKDYKKAEDYLKQSTRVSDRNILYYLSRMTLANLYNDMGKSDQGIQILNEAIEKNKDYVPQENLLMLLGETYKKAGKNTDAIRTFQKILDDYKDSPVSYQAQIRLNELKAK
jgi:tetratricopeptide (TPR) repeat protein